MRKNLKGVQKPQVKSRKNVKSTETENKESFFSKLLFFKKKEK